MKELPIYKLKGKGFFYLDKRLNEFRNIKNPYEIINFNNFNSYEIEKPTEEDKKIIWGD